MKKFLKGLKGLKNKFGKKKSESTYDFNPDHLSDNLDELDDDHDLIEDDYPSEQHEEDHLTSEHIYPGSQGDIPDIPKEFDRDLSEQLAAGTELPSTDKPELLGLKSVFEQIKDPKFRQSFFQNSKNKIESLQIDRAIESLFSDSNRHLVHRGFIWSLCLGSSAMIGQIIGGALNIQTKAITSKNMAVLATHDSNINKDLNEFDKANLFKANKHEIDKQADPINVADEKQPTKKIDLLTPCKKASNASKLPIELTHTVVLQDSVKSIAAVSIRGKKAPLTLREGDSIDKLGRIEKIEYQKMILKNLESGECEYILSQDSKKKNKRKGSDYKILSPKNGKKLLKNKDVATDVKNVGNKFTLKKSEKNKLLSNIDELLTQALAIQIKNPDGTLSFKMTEIVPGSLYTKLDLQNGDIIKTIGGKPISSLNQVMNLFGKISEIDQFQLGVVRNGSLVNKEYNFE